MKRSWIGFGLLIVILALSLLATGMMTRIHEDVALKLEQSSECALLGDWDDAKLFLTRARRNWDQWEHLRSCLMDHTPAEEMDAEFAALEVYRQSKNPVAYRAACAILTSRMKALAEAQKLTLWNIF